MTTGRCNHAGTCAVRAAPRAPTLGGCTPVSGRSRCRRLREYAWGQRRGWGSRQLLLCHSPRASPGSREPSRDCWVPRQCRLGGAAGSAAVRWVTDCCFLLHHFLRTLLLFFFLSETYPQLNLQLSSKDSGPYYCPRQSARDYSL